MEKTVLLTGASSGIGLCSANYLRSKGFTVLATARKPEDLKRLEEDGFETFELDVTSSTQIEQVVAKIAARKGGTLYGLVNCAGYAQLGSLEDISRDVMRAQFETNVFGLHELTIRVLPIMRKQGYGRIIHISSSFGLMAIRFWGTYCASKYAVEALGDSLRLELRGTHIYVSLIEPGPIATHFMERARKDFNAEVNVADSFQEQEYKRFVPDLGLDNIEWFRGQPIQVAKKIYHALSSKKPKIRYYITIPTYTSMLAKRFLPGRVVDFILSKLLN